LTKEAIELAGGVTPASDVSMSVLSANRPQGIFCHRSRRLTNGGRRLCRHVTVLALALAGCQNKVRKIHQP
jgi:hypothetical protein